jgi:predicted glycosyltransferase
MTREAAIPGVPSFRFFQGESGRVEKSLEAEGLLLMLRSVEDAAARLKLEKRKGALSVPDNAPLVTFIADALESAAC